MLVRFALDEAGHTGSLDCVKAVCYIMGNRVKAGWHDGTMLSVIEHAWESSGHDEKLRQELTASGRMFQMMLYSIDDIYFGNSEDGVRATVCDPKLPCLWYQFIDRKPRQWFVEHVARNPHDHPRRAQFGKMMLFA